MDYKYIEQLVERYFQAETTLHEEQILQAFFAQDSHDLPASLRQLAPLFNAIGQKEQLGTDFDERLLALTGQADEPLQVKARTISLTDRLRPLLKAAAIVAVVLTLSNALNQSFQPDSTWSGLEDYAATQPLTDEPAMAYDQNAADSLLVQGDSLLLSPTGMVE